MKKAVMLSAGLVLSGLMIATVSAGPSAGPGIRQAEDLQSAQAGTSDQSAPRKGLSKRNKAMIEQSEAASRMRRGAVLSGASGTIPKKASMSRREKARQEVTDQARKRQDLISSENSNTTTKTK